MKIKEISIGRGRKYSQNYQSVDYHVGITIEGTTVKDTVEDMMKKAIVELGALEIGEQERCRDVIGIIGLEEDREFKETVNKVAKKVVNKVTKMLPEPQFNKEKLEIAEEVLMDLTEVTVIFKTDKSVLVTKKGFQKWVAFSLMDGKTKDDFEFSDYVEDIPIREDKSVWFNEKKSWDKLEVAKK